MRSLIRGFVIASVLMLAAQPAWSAAQTTAFTYQGQLKQAGAPHSGLVDLQFRLWDDPLAGAQVAPLVSRDDVPVDNGIFTVEIDFGTVFGSEQRWIEVIANGTPLLPRQPVTTAPMALFALSGLQGPTGPTGDTGPMGPAGPVGAAGPAGLVWRGSWAASTLYAINEAVEYQGSSYVAVAATDTDVPGTGTAWQLLASGVDLDGLILIGTSPGEWKPFSSDDNVNLDFIYFSSSTWVTRNAAGNSFLSLHPSIPTVMYGRSVELLGVEFCYTAQANAYVGYVEINTVGGGVGAGSRQLRFSDPTPRTDSACRYYVLSTPALLTAEYGVNFYVQGVWTSSTNLALGRTTFVLRSTDTVAAPPSFLRSPSVASDASTTLGDRPSTVPEE
jgi:hypothetical protein